jgi:hypothetical protein
MNDRWMHERWIWKIMRSKQNIEGTNKGGKKTEFLGMLGRFAISTKKECQMNYFLSYNLNVEHCSLNFLGRSSISSFCFLLFLFFRYLFLRALAFSCFLMLSILVSSSVPSTLSLSCWLSVSDSLSLLPEKKSSDS